MFQLDRLFGELSSRIMISTIDVGVRLGIRDYNHLFCSFS